MFPHSVDEVRFLPFHGLFGRSPAGRSNKGIGHVGGGVIDDNALVQKGMMFIITCDTKGEFLY